MVPRTASIALSHVLMPYLEPILRDGIDGVFDREPALAAAVNIRRGQVVLTNLLGDPSMTAAG